nr:S8 family serine peptidase [Aeromicrobium stalagmiti]
MAVSEAHQQSTGKGVRIAVIDGAINTDVPELDGAKVTLRGAVKPDGSEGLAEARSYPTARYAGHGTAMTSLIVGQGKGNAPGGAGITGIAPDAEVFFYQKDPDPTDRESGYPSELFDQAIKDKVDIISYSFTNTLQLQYEVEQAQKAGIVVVAGAGNPNGPVTEPASIPGVVAVGAIDKDAKPWSKQPDGNLSIVAPGVDVASGIMEGPVDQARWVSGEERTGTSDATPLVAGALALVKSKYPDATGNQLIQQLIHSSGGRDFGYRQSTGFGVISLRKLLARDPSGWPDVNPLLKNPNDAFAAYPLSAWKDPKTTEPTSPSASPTPADDPTPQAATTADDSSGPAIWISIAAAVALLAVLLVLRHRRTTSRALTGTTGGSTDGTQ